MPLQEIFPRHLHGCIAYRVLLSNEGTMPLENARQILRDDGFENVRSLELLIQNNMVTISNDLLQIKRATLDGIDIRREILLQITMENLNFARKILRIGPVPKSTRGVENIAQMLREAHLFAETDLEVLRWWSNLRATIREVNTESDDGLDETGLLGELLTLEYERRRLRTNESIRWVSRWDGDHFGYDIKSFENEDLQEFRFIEVKASILPINEACVYLTFNEYRNLNLLGDAYYLYLWPEIGTESSNGPIIIRGNQVEEVLHQLNPNTVRWDGAVIIPFQELI
jgi:hypothetical protein